MALPSSGKIKVSDIKNEFPGETIPALSKYYRKGPRVVDIPANSKIPTSGKIKMSDFYSAQYFLPGFYELTINQSAQIDGSDFFWYGYFNNLSTPYHQVTHRRWQNASNLSGSYTLKKANLTNFSLDLFNSNSYGSLTTQSSGVFSTGYSVNALPFMIPKLAYKAYVAPSEGSGYTMTANEMIIQLTKNNGRLTPGVSLSETPSSSNGYTTIVLCDDDGAGSNAFYSFTLTYKWFVVAP